MEQKKELRRKGIQGRNQLTPQQREEYSARIIERILNLVEFQRAHTILIYKATTGEVNLDSLEDSMHTCDKRFIYPYCVSRNEMVAMQPCGKDAWATGRYGLLEPIFEKSNEIAPKEIDLIICPCTAFDEACNRIGMGAGYYDRYLEFCQHASAIAVAFETQKVEQIAPEPWDKSMEMIVTEENVYRSNY